MKKIIALAMLLAGGVLPLLAQPREYVAADFNSGVVYVMRDGERVWEHPAPNCNDVWWLDNGNFLFSTGNGVLEVNEQKDTIFCYKSKVSVYACQRLRNGNTFVGECESGRMLEINPKGEIVKELCLMPEQGVEGGPFGFIRNARRLKNGHYLLAHYGSGCVKEYDKKGREVWSVDVPGGAHSLCRLKNGNTMVAETDKKGNPGLIEFNRKGEVVWELRNSDFRDNPLLFMSGFQCFKDGSVMITNWSGHSRNKYKMHLMYLTRDKKELYRVDTENSPNLKAVASVHSRAKGSAH